VREAIFSILGDIEGAIVLDLFAGSGALALEAVSRGAASAVMVDSSTAAVKAMRRNLEKLNLKEVRISRSDYLNYLSGAAERGRRFDLIFIDPPYRMHRVIQQELVKLLPEVTAAGGRIVVESSSREEFSLPFERLVHKIYGDTAINIYRLPTGQPAPDSP
jgi:16S rRNA (guanine966-N2)-methyltransferase